jgi:hypothetical protein
VSAKTSRTRHGCGDGAIGDQHPRTILLRVIDFNYYREGYNTPIIPYTESIMKITKPFCNQLYLFSSHVNSASSTSSPLVFLLIEERKGDDVKRYRTLLLKIIALGIAEKT